MRTLASVLLIHAEDNGFRVAVGLFEQIGEVPRDGLGTGAQAVLADRRPK